MMLSSLLLLLLALLPSLASAAVELSMYEQANCTTWFASLEFGINGTSFSPPCRSSPSSSQALQCTVHGSPPHNYSSLSYQTWAQADCQGTLRSSWIAKGSLTGCSELVFTYKGVASRAWATVDCNSTLSTQEGHGEGERKWTLRTVEGKGQEVGEEAVSDAVRQQRMMEE